MTARDLDILDVIEGEVQRALGSTIHANIQLKRNAGSFADVSLFLASDQRPAGKRAAEALDKLDFVESTKCSGQRLSLRLTDTAIEAAGRLLEDGAFAKPRAKQQRPPALVGYMGANLCKALHIGHLRNLTVGHATTSLLKAAGRATRSYSLVGDIGRNVCEAMAGLEESSKPGDSAFDFGAKKPDAAIGQAYQNYVARSNAIPAEDADPCAREIATVGDRADRILDLWRQGDAGTRELWNRLCRLVDGGHQQTLARLGMTIDEQRRESDYLAQAFDLVERGLERQLFVKEPGGMVVCDTGREEYRRMVIARSDGFPTEHARVLAVFGEILNQPGGCEHIDWNGTEWEPAQRVMHGLLQSLDLLPPQSVHRPMIHGMVLVDGDELSSSRGEPPLIDDLIDRLCASRQLHDRLGTAIKPEVLAAIVVKAFFLAAPPSKAISFSWDALMSAATNPGWTIAAAWCRSADGRPGEERAGNEAYRVSVMQLLGADRAIAQAASELRYVGLVKFLVNFCERYLEAPLSPRHDRLARAGIEFIMNAIGLKALPNAQAV